MRALVRALTLVCVSSVALAADTDPLCYNYMEQDRQPDFSSGGFAQRSSIELTSANQLRLDTDVRAVNPEAGIILPFEQRVTVDYVYQSGGAWWALGYLFYDDLVAAGYVDTKGTPDTSDDTLVDARPADGMPDFHADLYNMGNRPFIGGNRACSTTFSHGGKTFYVPTLATRSCGNTYVASVTTPLFDARPGRTTTHRPATVGEFINSGTVSATQFGDGGLYSHVPNLLEPADPLNRSEGIGHLIFLMSDDDGDRATTGGLSPVADIGGGPDGIPDYDSSAYDGVGRLLTGPNPNPGVSAYDRRVDLGILPGGREIVFYFITGLLDGEHAKPSRYSGKAEVFPCAVQDPVTGECKLHLKTPISVFFSKSLLNMDQNPLVDTPAAVRDIGCPYNGDATCNETGSPVQGWLDLATMQRLNTAAYGFLDLTSQHEVQRVARPTNDRMPHIFVGAPSKDPFRWILGFEDLNGGGDRDFNDVVFLVNRQNIGVVTSGVVSGDISPSVAPDYTITTVRFTRDDDTTTCGGTPPCFHEDRPGACTGASPAIDYDVAVDCRLCDGTTCANNPNPTWTRVRFPETTPPTRTAELNMLDLGFTGSQLCWRAQIRSSNQYCRPTINNIDVNYQALKAGRYSRSAVTPVGNAILFGDREVAGQAMTPPPGRRVYDNRLDFSLRGHLTLQSLYAPETPNRTTDVERWNAGRVLSDSLRTRSGDIDDPQDRKLYTSVRMPLGAYLRNEVRDELARDNALSRAFPLSLCSELSAGKPIYDLDKDGVCDGRDRQFLGDWLYGYEKRADNLRRPWPVGGIDQSTAAFVGPAGKPGWWYLSSLGEQQDFLSRYVDGFKDRRGTAYVGTINGFLHAFDAGRFRLGDDPCTSATEIRGYFELKDTSCSSNTTRDYGTGVEQFAYLPGLLMSRYAKHYVSYRPGEVPEGGAVVNASPTVADVDLGNLAQPPWTRSRVPTRGAKTTLVSTTGKDQNVVFALDISDPKDPLPLWEYLLNEGLESDFAEARRRNSRVKLPDTRGSRHSPAVVRMRFDDTGADVRWVAVVGTDYQPNPDSAGAVYLIDMATGKPVVKDGKADLGVVTLEQGEGVGGEPTVVDVDQDGTFDLIYVPSTSGRVYRINPTRTDGTLLGQRLATCKVADVPADLSSRSDATLQRIHSSVSTRVMPGKVRFFLGTGDDPDTNDAAANNYFMMAYEDLSPRDAACDGATLLWKKALRAGERVWGGVIASGTDVYTTTAVGATSQPCDLSSTQFGAFYALSQEPDAGNQARELAGSGTTLGGHGLSAPVLYDNHLFIASARGKPVVVGNDKWNNQDGLSAQRGTRVLIYDVSPDGRLAR
ncbi:DUF4114 domain-containing protein [Myxococcus sp. K15C18031901]|uniref:DUF4114 domain-containing protein n=1 Tax=Myxococcus dinghuensis TaxID=2906761 RepID=UPI0020A6DFEE|nr:DUF4114 domain-containing protein [Myxococcus dinghuensis]MCP3102474.1 DUF4114 domain-containing protein [Myxococcus dinghuensis]